MTFYSSSYMLYIFEFIKFEYFELQIKSYLGNYIYTNFNNETNSNKQIRLFLSDLYKEIDAE